MRNKQVDIIETIVGSSDKFSLPNQIFNAITFSGFLITLLIFIADNVLDKWWRDHNFAFGLTVTIAYLWLYGKSRESGDYKDYTIFYALLELFMFLQSWFMHGGIVGVSLLIALHYIITISMILEGLQKYAYIAFILIILSGLFAAELLLPDIVRPYTEHKYLLIDVFIFIILIGGGIVVCVVLVMQNHRIQYERINQFNTSLDLSKKELEQKVKEQNEARGIIQKSLKEKELLLREVHHRVKNNLQIISSLLLLQQNKLENQATINALNTAGSRVQSIALVHELLYRSETIAHIDFQSYAKKLVRYLSDMYQRDNNVAIEVDTGTIALSIEDAISCGLIVTELVSNSLKYAFPNKSSGRIEIILSDSDRHRYEMCIFDDGIGWSDDLQWESSPTLGLLLVRELVEGQLGGTIQLERSAGTLWTISWTNQPPSANMGEGDEGF